MKGVFRFEFVPVYKNAKRYMKNTTTIKNLEISEPEFKILYQNHLNISFTKKLQITISKAFKI